MTRADARAKAAGIRHFVADEGKKVAARWAIMGVALFLGALVTPYGKQALAVWRSPQETAARLDRIEAAQAETRESIRLMQAALDRATGEDRVIRQTPGLSYVEEPVHRGENVTMFMVAERTTLGADCRLVDWTPLFTDEGNVTIPGQRASAGPVRRQIGDAPVKLRIEMVPPPELRPGRVELYLALVYECGGKTVPDRTDVVTYRLLE